jgi:hypothetical protein
MIATEGGEPITVKLLLGRLAYNLIMEEYPLSEKYITKQDASHWLLDTKVANLQGVGRFTIGLMDDIEIIESPELKEYINNYINKYFI